ncbi:MAG TPA: hypothetical protein VHB77_00710 [Planctomycetaceae bacterium]|nr:hypothetical protein [Planctomycetaceae bacterium]
MHVEPAPFFECVWIAEAEDGDLDAGAIGGIISRWWVMDDAGLSGEVCPLKLRFADDSTLFDTQPVLKFFMSGDGVVLGEWFGPRLICRKVGRVVVSDAVVSVIDLRVTWVAQV